MANLHLYMLARKCGFKNLYGIFTIYMKKKIRIKICHHVAKQKGKNCHLLFSSNCHVFCKVNVEKSIEAKKSNER